MALKIVTAPTVEPVTLEDYVKSHLNVTATTDDALLAFYITVARIGCEGFSNRAYIMQTWDLYLDGFPNSDEIKIPLPPLQTVTWLKYKAMSTGVLTEWANTNYIVDTMSEPGRIVLAYGKSWPSTYDEIQAVQIRFVCGYATAADVPAEIKLAILLKVAQLYEHRGDEVPDPNIENAIENSLWPDRIVPI